MNDNVKKLWPELDWIKDELLREKTARTWEKALEKSVLKAEDLDLIPFTLLCGPDLASQRLYTIDHSVHVPAVGSDNDAITHRHLPFDHSWTLIDARGLITAVIFSQVVCPVFPIFFTHNK